MWLVVLESLTLKMLHPDSGLAKGNLLFQCLLNFPCLLFWLNFSFWDFSPLCLRVDDSYNQRSIEFLQSSLEFTPCLSRDLKYINLPDVKEMWEGSGGWKPEDHQNNIWSHTWAKCDAWPTKRRVNKSLWREVVTTNAYWLTGISMVWRG